MTTKFTLTSSLLVLATAIIMLAFVLTAPRFAGASAPPGLQADVLNATSSNPAVTTTGALIIATSSCSARIITTTASPIMLTFSDNQGKIPTAFYGHLQPASTTVAYDSGIYGCGAVKAYSFVAQNISVTETR